MNLPKGPFGTVLADPPWSFRGGGRLGQEAKKRKEGSFLAMTLDELKILPVRDVVADRAHCYIWFSSGAMRDAWDLMESWGFIPGAQLVWVKRGRRRSGCGRQWCRCIHEDVPGPLQIGMGRNWRRAHELVLFGSRNHLPAKCNNIATVFEAPNPRVEGKTVLGRKPPLFYDIVEKQSPGPYLEMFARVDPREGWEAWGNEVGKYGDDQS